MSFITDFAAQQTVFMNRVNLTITQLTEENNNLKAHLAAIQGSGETLGPVTTASLAAIQNGATSSTKSLGAVNVPIQNSPPVFPVSPLAGSGSNLPQSTQA